ncbi:hypothetical protein EV702DRAFT_1125884 [Suillus placidus]|uniref:DUF6533 domain-containing protein n=1 Tax=Suillus placidus TaxID=48579 RepID=A0A9P6ZP78_9AGAM|nr:hypothetical protein EV702DRAFT_1125884 [Suillus placidus]
MTTIWTYDYACSLHDEWIFLLRSRWTKAKCLYIIARNVPFVVLTTDLYMSFTPNNNPDKCLMMINIYSCFSFISVFCSECIFVLRICALWNKNRFVLATMLCASLAVLVASMGVAFTTIAASHGMTSTISGITGCYRTTSRSVQLSMPFLLLFMFELGVSPGIGSLIML